MIACVDGGIAFLVLNFLTSWQKQEKLPPCILITEVLEDVKFSADVIVVVNVHISANGLLVCRLINDV